MAEHIKNVVIFGSSGYTGAEAVRFLLQHPRLRITALSAHSRAGEPYETIYPQFRGHGLPTPARIEDIDLSDVDVVFSCLPHATGQAAMVKALEQVETVIDVSADFRLRDPAAFADVYGSAHQFPELLDERVYGLTEYVRDALPGARLVACPGCFPTCTLLALLPGVEAGLFTDAPIVVDAKTGVSGAGRKSSQAFGFSEQADGAHPYAIGTHRHAPEIEQELALRGYDTTISFTPHIVPMNRGMIATCYATLAEGVTPEDVREAYQSRYASDRFVTVLPEGIVPQTRHVRGSNEARIGVFADRAPGRVVIVSVIDNLAKGSSGQAVQNYNLSQGWDEELGLGGTALFP